MWRTYTVHGCRTNTLWIAKKIAGRLSKSDMLNAWRLRRVSSCILNLRRRSTTRLQDVAKRCQKRASLKIGCLVFPLHRKSARRMENPSPKLLMLQEQWDLRVRRNSDDANGICQTCYSTMSILPSPSVCTTRKAFRAKWAASFSRAANSRARRSSRSTDVSSSFCRLSVTRRKMAGVSPVCLFVVLGHDVDFEKRCV